ncbi:hypothetical protein LAZ67_14000713 [Cordylochernes scorpioides]|uniref:Integrase catalytic domain-containing protein n=1 Tax=Cordylochernes scorpioides TaxID=51811 RepID=A0ABY6L665_9ARAC|nr:hypothetical protein LAZ67_14000713 [Cordylochernes scorpioides]
MEMEYEQSRREFFRHSLFGGSSTDVVEHEVYTIHLSDINNSYRCEFEALGQPLICGSIPPVCPRSLLEGSEELDVSDLMRDRIEVLIGADIAGRLLTDDQRRISSGLVAIRTKLGWTVMGKIPPTEVRDDISSLCVTTLLSLDLENLWKLDAIGVSDAEVEKKTQSLQAEMEEHFAHTTTRDIEGRYEVALPWVQDKERIPSNKDLAENQLRSVRRKLEEVGDMKEYGQIFEEWMKQGIIEYAREDKLDGVHYLPHRPVYKRNSQTSRIRPVFNASARKRDKAPEHLKITAEQLKSSFYVDNCLSSFQNVEETEKFVKESTELLSTACFNLRDWDSYVEKTTLHIFCDASQFAYATCIFLRIEKEDRVDIQLIQARTRVAPLKKLTIPRLELLACLIGARLAANVIQDLEFEEIPRFYWTDSTNALCWIQREDNWAAFVMNRVKEIHNLSSPESWRHIPGRLNPADLPSRGCSAESLKETRWWEGPAWLKVSQEEWPKSTIIPDLEIVYSERRKTILNTLCTTRENENLFGRYSHFLRIVRITAWIYRFFNNAKIDRRKIISEDLSTEEITKSEIILIRLIQRESFSGHEDKKLQGFKLLVDSSGILRIKTKICRREDFANFRMPILLPSDHFLVSLLIRWNHETHGHAGLQTLLGILRENYWILRSRKTVKKIINQCIRCKRFTATPATVESTSLPEDRVRDAAVFEIVGVDLTGHLILKNKKKAWIVIFTCAVYRGVHLELVTSLSMEAFLQAFRRFIARRGRPLIVYSDNGTNFKGIANALKKIDFSRLKCDPTLKNITWKFIPPGAPWWGGWWERLIGMMKQLLFRILGQTSLGYEELSTVMCDVESLMNTRPLTYLTEESEDLAPLTPSLFLHEVREVGVPDLDLIDNQTLSRKYQYIKRVREDLRERFRIEYFGFLRQETRRLKTTIPLKVGDMVLIGQESLKRLHWPLARIIQLYPGKDGLVRVAKVKTSSGDKIRPIQKLYNLEITPEIRCRDPLTERSPTQEVRLTTEEDPLTSQQEQHHIDTPNVVSSYGRPIKRPNRLDLLNFSFPCLSRRDANSKMMCPAMAYSFSLIDYIIFVAMVMVSGVIGVYYRFSGGRQTTSKEFLVANHSMGPVPVSFSLMASFMSAVTLLGVSQEMYRHGTMFILINISYCIGTPLAAHIFLPVFYSIRATSAFQYLELRFDKRVRLLASFIFMLQTILYMSIVLYAPALALSAVTTLSKWASILALGVVCTFYCSLGGIKAVLWTDVFQSLLMFASIISIIIIGANNVGGLGQVWAIAKEGGRIEFDNTANLFNFECQTFEAIIADTSLDSPEKIQMATKGLILTLVQEAELLLKDAFKGASLGRPNPTANVPIPSTSFASVVAEKDKPVKPAPPKPKAKSTFVNLAPSFESHVVVRVDGEVRDDEICESFRSNHSVQSLLEKREIRVVHRSNNAAHSTSTVIIEVDNQVAEILGQHGRIPVAGLVHRPLRVLQVNAKKSPTVILEIANLANSTQADIVLLQELSTNFFWPTHTAITSIAICLEQSIIVVHSANWHGLRAADDFIPLLEDTIRRASLPVILGMDTNAHSPTWGIGARLDFRGANLEEFASFNDLHFLGPPVDSTWSNGPLSSSIDVTLASSSLAIHVTRCLSDEMAFTDHIPIWTTFLDMVNNETKSSWVESSCKEQTFKSFLNSSLHQRLADRHGWFFEDQYKTVLGTVNGRSAEDALASEERQAHWRKTLVISSDIKSSTEALRAFRNFKGIRRGKGPMSCYSLRRMIKNFEKTGSLEAKPRSGRPSTRKSVAVTVSQNVEAIETLSTYGEDEGILENLLIQGKIFLYSALNFFQKDLRIRFLELKQCHSLDRFHNDMLSRSVTKTYFYRTLEWKELKFLRIAIKIPTVQKRLVFKG